MDISSKPLSEPVVLEVAVPVPLRQTFDFLLPSMQHQGDRSITVGARVKVPFGPRKLVGVIVAIKATSDYPQAKLKRAEKIIDDSDIFDAPLWATLNWLSRYYLAAIGEVIETAMPVALRHDVDLMPPNKKTWRLSDIGRSSAIEDLDRAPLQLAIIKRFMGLSSRNSDSSQNSEGSLSSEDFKQDSGGWRSAIKALIKKGWIEEYSAAPVLKGPHQQLDSESELEATDGSTVLLTKQQQTAADLLTDSIAAAEFSCSLLYGVTGSGKTEVYFAAMQKVLDLDQQVLLLVPEIGLTPQLVSRVQKHFNGQKSNYPVVALHSGLNDSERHLAWWHARRGNAKIVIGTRSAVFTNCANLGLIVVDEEHDGSFKQQDGVRYQARDVAIYRAKQHNIPIVLGTATPSLESYRNALQGRYKLLELKERATNVQLPDIELIDLNRQPANDGLSPAMLEAISSTLVMGKQVMLFLNRRGYAPVLYCKDCSTACHCHRCDANMTIHRRNNLLRCHHCGNESAIPQRCASCQSESLVEVGEGTQRVEDALALRFPAARLLRIDRDSTRRKGELASLLEQARNGEADILLGTQLITKGHDFPWVGTVGILDSDQGLYSTDYRASEALFQQILQVAGRAGRRSEVGRVFIQTHFVQHPFFSWVKQHNYEGFAEHLLAARAQANYPPFGYFALLRAESTHQAKALQFLRRAKHDMRAYEGVLVMDAVPAPMERRAGKFRAQLLISGQQRSNLNASLAEWLNYIGDNKEARKLSASVRWSLDVDPIDHY